MQQVPGLYLDWDTNTKGALTRARTSVEALRTLRHVQGEERKPTDGERQVMALWSGWGPLTPIFKPPTESWEKLADEVLDMLTPEQVDGARQATYSAFYTPPAIAQAVWGVLSSFGFDGGTVLEPGCGAGVFLAHTPADTDRPVRMVGVERDPTTAAIAAMVHPQARIIASAFEDAPVAECSVNAVVGNVPFGDVSVFDPGAHKSVRDSLHGYFVWRSLRALRPGGVAVLISSRYLLDRAQSYARQAFEEEGQFLGAVRMPNDALASGGTSVATDIVVFRKRRPGEERDDNPAWLEAELMYDLGGEWVNKWVVANPRAVIGTLAEDSARGRYGRTVKVAPPDDAPKGAELARWVAGRVRQVGEELARQARQANRTWHVDPEPGADPATQLADADGRKERSFHLDDTSGVRQVQGGRLVPVRNAGPELVALIQLRDAALALLDAEADHRRADHELVPLRGRVNTLYEAYVAEFGYLNRAELRQGHPDPETNEATTVRIRPNMGGFRKDPDYVTVLALEVWNDETRTGTKAPILLGRVNKPARWPDRADSPAEALALCLDMHGKVVLPEIARLLRLGDPGGVPPLLADLLYHEPAAQEWVTSDEYLSGNVRTKLEVARRAAQRDPDRYGRNVAALEKAQPKDLEPGEIRAQLGSPWIPPSDVADFLEDLLGRRPKVTRTTVNAEWNVEIGDVYRDRAAATVEWGTGRVDAYRLAELHLNGKTPVVHDRVRTTDGDKNVKNQAETMAAEAKQRQLAARFAEWVWEDPERSDRLAAEYNQRFNAHVLRGFDGSHLTFPGMDPDFHPYTHQRDMVYRAVCTPRTLCGHAVGAGKTASMFMIAMTLRRLGLVNKPLIVVPNHLLEQVAREGRQLFPAARVLMAGREDLKDAADRKLFAARTATGDWDAIVITHSVFGRVPVHPHTEADYLWAKVEEFRSALAEHDASTGRRYTTKQLEKAVANMRARAQDLLHKATDDGLHFAQLGVDYLLVDEAHYYKALAVPVRTEGFSVRASKRAFDLDMKLRWLSQRRDRCATLFTGTPVSNTMLELYVMQHYLAPELLDDLGIGTADAWAANFVSFESHVEVSPDGVSFRMKRRPSRFVNVPELRLLLAQFADIRNADELGLKSPAARYHTVVAPSTAQQKAYVDGLVARLEKAHSGGRDAAQKILGICTDGRKAAIDPALVGVGGRARKVEAVVERVAAIHRASQGPPMSGPTVPEVDDRFTAYVRGIRETAGADNVLQVVFCDFGTPNDERGDQVYGKIRRGLVDRGVPARAIRFIHDYGSDRAKASLFADCRAGKVAVLLGSTDKLGVGTNVQRVLVAMHHVDAPWRPADIEQREGRGLRPGNLFPIVQVYRHVTRESFDTFMWQTLERKARFIGQVLTGQGNARVVEDIGGDGTLSAGEVKALAAGNELLMEKSEVDGEVTRLRMLYSQHMRAQKRLRGDIAGWERMADQYRATADDWAAVDAVVDKHDGPAAADHRGDPLDDEALVGYLGQLAKEATESGYAWRHVQLRGVRVQIVAGVEFGKKYMRATLSDGREHEVTVELDYRWARPTQQVNIPPALWAGVDGAAKRAANLRERADDYAGRVAGAAGLEGKPFAEAEALRVAEDRLADIEAQIRQAARELVEKGVKGEAVAATVIDDDEPVEVHSGPVPEIPEHYRNPQPSLGTVPVVQVKPQPAPDAASDGSPLPAALRVPPESPGEPGVTYKAAWHPDEATVTVMRDMRAGVCGPFGEYPATSREEATNVLATNGYTVASEWWVSKIRTHWCALVRVPHPVNDIPTPKPYNAPVKPASVKPRRSRPHRTGTKGCTRNSVGRQLRHAAEVLGIEYETGTDASGAPVCRVGGREMTAMEAADYLLAGGFLAAMAGGPTVVHPDRLSQRGLAPARVTGSWASLLLS